MHLDRHEYNYLRDNKLFLTNDMLPAGQVLKFPSSCRYTGCDTALRPQDADRKLLEQERLEKEHGVKELAVSTALCMKIRRRKRGVLRVE